MINPVYDTDDTTILRSSTRVKYLVIFDPCAVVFQAQVASVPEGETYINIVYDTVSIGTYTDVRVGQMVLISETSDYTDALYEMRVADTPSGVLLPVNESADVLVENLYITVIDTYKPKPRVRKGALVDGRFAFEDLAPVIEGLPSVLFAESAGDGAFTFPDVVGRSLTGGTITYEWDIPDFSYTGGTDANDQHPQGDAPHGHQWGHLKVIDSNGPTHTQHFQLIVQNPKAPTLAARFVDSVRIKRTWQGHHATLRAYKNATLSDVMNDTRTVIIALRAFKGGAIDYDPVAFVGYVSKEQNSTTSPSDKSVSFEIAGIWERAASLPLNPIAVRDVASPTAWDQIALPTAQRVAAHVLERYSTITTLCALNLDDITDTWYGGDMDVNVSSLGDAIEQVTSEINAVILQAPSGELYFRRDLRFEADDVRDDADVAYTLSNADLVSLDIGFNHLQQTGRLIIGFRRYLTDGSPSEGGKAMAPAVTLGTSSETQTRANQLLRADQSLEDMLQEAAQRVGDILAYENSNPQIAGAARNWGVFSPAADQWVTGNVIPATNTRGRGLFGRMLIASLDLSYDQRAGVEESSVEFFPETRGGRAIVVAMIVPNVAQITSWITSPRGAYSGSYPTPATLNVPDATQRRPFRRQDMGGMGNPEPQDQGYDEGQRQPRPGHANFAISFKNPAPVNAGFTSVLGAHYRITASGVAQIATDAWTFTQDFTSGAHGWTTYDNGFGNQSVLTSAGWEHGVSGAQARITITTDFSSYTTPLAIGSIQVNRSASVNNGDTNQQNMYYPTYPGPSTFGSVVESKSAIPTSVLYSGGSLSSLAFDVLSDFLTSGVAVPGAITSIVYEGSGTNPFTGMSGAGPLWADPLYVWNEDADGNRVNIRLNPNIGLKLNNSALTPPPYNPAGVYTVDVVGTGSPFSFVFYDANYADNQNVPLTIDIQGQDAA